MLEGEISQIQLIERLVELWREQFTGAIRFENDGIIKIIYFKGGDILSASTNDRSDSIDEILMRAGKVSREHVKQALAKRKESETLGDALLNLGFITRKELTWARRVQVVGVIRSIAAWTEGSFTIVADYLPKRDEGTLFPLPQVLVELIVTEQDRARFERALDGGDLVFTKTDDFDDVWRRLGLNEDAEAIAAEIDGEKSASAVATASGRDTFNVYKLLHALATLGVLAPATRGAVSSAEGLAVAGAADATDLWNSPNPELTDEDFAQPGPAFELDAEPTPMAPTRLSALPVPPPSAWDETDDVALDLPVQSEVPAGPMPSWNAPPPIAPLGPAQSQEEDEQWGFDEAQLDASRSSMPPAAASTSAPQKQHSNRHGLLVLLLVLAIVAGAGYYGFMWWQGRQDAAATRTAALAPGAAQNTPAPASRTTDTAVAAPVASATAPATTTASSTMPTTVSVTTPGATTSTVAPSRATSTSATTTTATTTTAAAPPATRTPAPASTPEPTSGQALPRVTARTPASAPSAATPAATGTGRDRLDAMARNYAANPSGNFTVQIQILCDWSNLEKLTRSGGDNVWFVPQTIGERSCYRVFWGRYNTREQAQQALGQIPASARDRNAAVKSVPGR